MLYSNTSSPLAGLRRTLTVAVLTLTVAFAMSGTAHAFVPPGDGAAGNFDCGAGGHPGSAGQFTAMEASDGPAAWAAHANSDRIINC